MSLKIPTRAPLKATALGALAGLTSLATATLGCTGDQSSNDPNAIYGYLKGKHTFIVGHLFDARIYQDQLDTRIIIDPDLTRSGENHLFNCFYELRLSDEEIDQCGAATGDSSYARPIGEQLDAMDVWRLMALRDDKVESLSQNIILRKELESEINRSWQQGPERATLQSQIIGPGSADLRLHGNTSALGLVDIGGMVNGAASGAKTLLGDVWNRGKEWALNSASCLALDAANPNHTQGIVNGIVRGLGNNPLIGAVAAPVVGVLLAPLTRFATGAASGALGADQLAAATCGNGIARAGSVNQKPNAPTAPTAPTTNQQLVRQASLAVRDNDANALKRILNEEMQMERRSLGNTGSDMGPTLSDTFNPLSDAGIHRIRNNIITLGERSARATANTACISPRRFAREVLEPALIAARAGSESDLSKQRGCTSRSTNSGNAQNSNNSTASSTVAPSEIEALKKRVEELAAELAIARRDLGVDGAGASSAAAPSSEAASPQSTAAVLQKFAAKAPSTCVASEPSISALAPSELAARLATCTDQQQGSNESNTFGNFSTALRLGCVEKSAATDAAKATCLCSCRWSTAFYRYLTK